MLLSILKGTPWWVWLLLWLVVSRGLKAMRTHDVPLRKMLILPAVLVIWSMSGLWHSILLALSVMSVGNIALCVTLAAAVGALLGNWLGMQLRLRPTAQQGIARVEGDAQTLVVVLTVFLCKYALGAATGINPQLEQNALYLQVLLAMDAFFIALFVVRSTAMLLAFRRSVAGRLTTG